MPSKPKAAVGREKIKHMCVECRTNLLEVGSCLLSVSVCVYGCVSISQFWVSKKASHNFFNEKSKMLGDGVMGVNYIAEWLSAVPVSTFSAAIMCSKCCGCSY